MKRVIADRVAAVKVELRTNALIAASLSQAPDQSHPMPGESARQRGAVARGRLRFAVPQEFSNHDQTLTVVDADRSVRVPQIVEARVSISAACLIRCYLVS